MKRLAVAVAVVAPPSRARTAIGEAIAAKVSGTLSDPKAPATAAPLAKVTLAAPPVAKSLEQVAGDKTLLTGKAVHLGVPIRPPAVFDGITEAVKEIPAGTNERAEAQLSRVQGFRRSLMRGVKRAVLDTTKPNGLARIKSLRPVPGLPGRVRGLARATRAPMMRGFRPGQATVPEAVNERMAIAAAQAEAVPASGGVVAEAPITAGPTVATLDSAELVPASGEPSPSETSSSFVYMLIAGAVVFAFLRWGK